MSILNVEHLSHGFGDRAIFGDVSFRLLKGEHIGLVGANGEGKSTFLNIVTGNATTNNPKPTKSIKNFPGSVPLKKLLIFSPPYTKFSKCVLVHFVTSRLLYQRETPLKLTLSLTCTTLFHRLLSLQILLKFFLYHVDQARSLLKLLKSILLKALSLFHPLYFLLKLQYHNN